MTAWRAGVLKRIKRAYGKKLRQMAKRELAAAD
jgi:hypothetical protein